jgi:hypothetical protein
MPDHPALSIKVPFKLGELLILLPLLHLACTITFVFTYGAVFGAGIREFLSAADVANTAVREMPVVYGILLISLVIGLAIPSYRAEHYTDSGRLAIPIRVAMFSFLMILAGLILAIGVYKSYHDHVAFNILYAMFAIVTFPVLSVLISLFRMNVSPEKGWPALLLCSVLCVSIVQGAEAARRDRYALYADSSHPRPTCNRVAILRTVSDKLLVVKPNGKKAVYTAECKPFIDIPEPVWLSSGALPTNRLKASSATPPHGVPPARASG